MNDKSNNNNNNKKKLSKIKKPPWTSYAGEIERKKKTILAKTMRNSSSSLSFAACFYATQLLQPISLSKKIQIYR